MIVSQAPGTAVHETGLSFNDPSGDRLLALMPEIRLTLLVGTYALTHVLGRGAMTARVRDFRAHLPRYFALPHPSWRTTAWERRNPWFGQEVLPALHREVAIALGDQS